MEKINIYQKYNIKFYFLMSFLFKKKLTYRDRIFWLTLKCFRTDEFMTLYCRNLEIFRYSDLNTIEIDGIVYNTPKYVHELIFK